MRLIIAAFIASVTGKPVTANRRLQRVLASTFLPLLEGTGELQGGEKSTQKKTSARDSLRSSRICGACLKPTADIREPPPSIPMECVAKFLPATGTLPRRLGRGIAVRPRKPADNRIFQHFPGGLFLENLFDAARKLCRIDDMSRHMWTRRRSPWLESIRTNLAVK